MEELNYEQSPLAKKVDDLLCNKRLFDSDGNRQKPTFFKN